MKHDGRKTNRTTEELERIRTAFKEWVQHILDQKSWTPTDLANKSELAPSTLLRIMNSESHPFNISFMTIRKVADGSGYPVPRSLMEAHGISEHSLPREDAPVRARTEGKTAARGASSAPQEAQKADMIPLRHITSLPRAFSAQVPDGRTVCPPQMLGDETAVAFTMPDDSLLPAVRPGMTLYGTKRRDPASGDIVMLLNKEGIARIRYVEAVDEDGFHLQRLYPEKKVEVLAFSDIEDFAVIEGVWRR